MTYEEEYDAAAVAFIDKLKEIAPSNTIIALGVDIRMIVAAVDAFLAKMDLFTIDRYAQSKDLKLGMATLLLLDNDVLVPLKGDDVSMAGSDDATSGAESSHPRTGTPPKESSVTDPFNESGGPQGNIGFDDGFGVGTLRGDS